MSIRPLPDTMAKITAVLPVEQAVACFAIPPARRRNSESDRGRTHQSPDQGRHPRRTDHRPDHRRRDPGGGPAGDDQRRPPGTLRGTRPTPRPRTTPRVPGPPHHHPRPRRHRSPSVGTAVAHRPHRRHRRHHRHQTAPVRRRPGGVDQRPRPSLPRPLLLSAHPRPRPPPRPTPTVGPPAADNGIGLCQRGNLVDQIPGWHTTGTATHRVVITPTGHRYDTRPPPALGPRLPRTGKPGEQLPRAG